MKIFEIEAKKFAIKTKDAKFRKKTHETIQSTIKQDETKATQCFNSDILILK